MSKKLAIWIIVAIIVVIGGIYLFNKGSSSTSMTDTSGTDAMNGTSTSGNSTNPNSTAAGDGQVTFSVTDAAASMSAVSEVNMKVNKVEVHNTAGWTTVSTTPHTYALLALNASNQDKLLATVKVKSGMYDQVRLNIDSVSVKTKAGETKNATLPSHSLTIDTILPVTAGTTSSVNMDFLADKSLFLTSKNAYVFAPSVKTESRSAVTIAVDTNSTVTITGGAEESSNNEAMDVDGVVKLNFTMDPTTIIDLNTDGSIDLNGELK